MVVQAADNTVVANLFCCFVCFQSVLIQSQRKTSDAILYKCGRLNLISLSVLDLE